MKQIIICDNAELATSALDLTSSTPTLLFYHSADPTTPLTELDSNFAINFHRPGKAPINFPEVDVKTLQVTVATYNPGRKWSTVIDFNDYISHKGKHLTVHITRLGKHFNERNTWTFDDVARCDDDFELITKNFAEFIKTNFEYLELVASGEHDDFKLESVKNGDNYRVWVMVNNIIEFDSETSNNTTIGTVAILDNAYVKDLASRCAAGKGFNDNDENINPGYPEPVLGDKYTMYTLRFAVPRVAAKQRDEVVYQILHICVPFEGDLESSLDDMFEDFMAQKKKPVTQPAPEPGPDPDPQPTLPPEPAEEDTVIISTIQFKDDVTYNGNEPTYKITTSQEDRLEVGTRIYIIMGTTPYRAIVYRKTESDIRVYAPTGDDLTEVSNGSTWIIERSQGS